MHPISILVVSPHRQQLTAVETALKSTTDRLSVETVPSIDEAATMATRHGYGCVVVADTPEWDATELVEAVRETDAELPIVVYDDGGPITGGPIPDGVTDVLQGPDIAGDDRFTRRITNAAKAYTAVLEAERRRDRFERFVEVVSHDLRNPLNVAQGYIDRTRETDNTDHLETASDAIDRSLALITDLLRLAREGEAVSSTERVDLAALTQTCWETTETADATLELDTDQVIEAQESRLKQLLVNLLGNAVHHGGAGVTVTVGAIEPVYTSTRGASEQRAGFYIEDDGSGIPADERSQVFETGYTTADDGTGFGLNIAREIAVAHGWEIQVTESEAGGARFDITGVTMVR